MAGGEDAVVVVWISRWLVERTPSVIKKNRGEGCWRWLIVERLRERIREARVNVVSVG
jgi:hypothetical protein